MLLYSKQDNNVHQQEFYKDVTGKTFSQISMQAAKSLYIRTNDLEQALKKYALSLGAKIKYENITSCAHVHSLHPNSQYFIACDGAHSKLRQELMKAENEQSIKSKTLAHVLELKCEVPGDIKRSKTYEQLQINSKMEYPSFEFMGKSKTSSSSNALTLRIFLPKEVYETLPPASFKEPLSIDSPALPVEIKNHITSYLSSRLQDISDAQNLKLTKLQLNMYHAPSFQATNQGKSWFLAGDAAMGVPYFRALNSGMILSSRLAQILCANTFGAKTLAQKKLLYKAHEKMHITTEFAIAKAKNLGLESYKAVHSLIKPANQDVDAALWAQENFNQSVLNTQIEDKALKLKNAPPATETEENSQNTNIVMNKK